jgi:hypothetical protein
MATVSEKRVGAVPTILEPGIHVVGMSELQEATRQGSSGKDRRKRLDWRRERRP